MTQYNNITQEQSAMIEDAFKEVREDIALTLSSIFLLLETIVDDGVLRAQENNLPIQQSARDNLEKYKEKLVQSLDTSFLLKYASEDDLRSALQSGIEDGMQRKVFQIPSKPNPYLLKNDSNITKNWVLANIHNLTAVAAFEELKRAESIERKHPEAIAEFIARRGTPQQRKKIFKSLAKNLKKRFGVRLFKGINISVKIINDRESVSPLGISLLVQRIAGLLKRSISKEDLKTAAEIFRSLDWRDPDFIATRLKEVIITDSLLRSVGMANHKIGTILIANNNREESETSIMDHEIGHLFQHYSKTAAPPHKKETDKDIRKMSREELWEQGIAGTNALITGSKKEQHADATKIASNPFLCYQVGTQYQPMEKILRDQADAEEAALKDSKERTSFLKRQLIKNRLKHEASSALLMVRFYGVLSLIRIADYIFKKIEPPALQVQESKSFPSEKEKGSVVKSPLGKFRIQD